MQPTRQQITVMLEQLALMVIRTHLWPTRQRIAQLRRLFGGLVM